MEIETREHREEWKLCQGKTERNGDCVKGKQRGMKIETREDREEWRLRQGKTERNGD
jgi:hypothetical protein